MKKTWKAILEDMDELDNQMDQAIDNDQTGGPDEGSFDSGDSFGSTDDADQSMDSSSSDDSEPADMEVEDDDSDESGDYGLDSNDVNIDGDMDELKQMYTPILIMNNFNESDAQQMQESMSNARVLTEANMLKFEPDTQAKQLISVTALLIARSKKSEKYDAFVKAYKLVKKLKAEILREEESSAKELARKFLQDTIDSNSNEDATASAQKLIEYIK